MSDILNVIECPVCLQVPESAPIFMCCENGHLVCGPCKRRLVDVKCPICRSEEGFIPNLTAQDLLEQASRNGSAQGGAHVQNGAIAAVPGVAAIPAQNPLQVPPARPMSRARLSFGRARLAVPANRRCENAWLGCTANNSGTHRVACQFKLNHSPRRLVKCPLTSCSVIKPATQMVKDHFIRAHPRVQTIVGERPLTVRIEVSDAVWNESRSYKTARYKVGETNYFRMTYHDRDTQSFVFWIYFDGAPSRGKHVKAEFSLLNEQNEAVINGKARIVPLDVPIHQIIEHSIGFVVSDSILRRQVIATDFFQVKTRLIFKA